MSLISIKKANIINEIEKSIVRADVVNGVYSSATFTYGKNKFTVIADSYDEKGNRTGSSIIKNGKHYDGSVVSNGRYRNISLYGADSLMEHQLLAVCLIPGATAELLSEKNMVINHKTISSKSLEARQAHYDDLKYWSVCYMNGRLDEYDKGRFYNKAYQPPCDVRELEVCTSAENVAHGALIKTFGLYDVQISAHDVPLLKQYLINEKQVEYTMNLYTKYGAEVMLSMLRD